MPRSAIEALPVRDYSQKPRVIHGIYGEKASIRLIDPTDRLDMARYMRSIRALPPIFSGRKDSSKKLINNVMSYQPGVSKDGMIFGIAGSNGNIEETGELQGWIEFQEDDCALELFKEGLITSHTAGVYEVAYSHIPGIEKGQIASGLRQACFKLLKCDPELSITAYVHKWNEASHRVVEAAGFEAKLGFDINDYEGHPLTLYMLNRDKLLEKIHKKGAERIGGELVRVEKQPIV